MAYTSYELTKDTDQQDYPIIIMHGLLGSKTNWNSLSKAIHNKTKKKVGANFILLYIVYLVICLAAVLAIQVSLFFIIY